MREEEKGRGRAEVVGFGCVVDWILEAKSLKWSMATDGSADHQAAQRRAIEGPSGSPHALTLEVDTDYYDALEGSDFDWQAAARSRTGTRVHWADSVVSPKQHRRLSLTESWHDENVAGEDLEEYSSWQISLGIANERAALTSPVRPPNSSSTRPSPATTCTAGASASHHSLFVCVERWLLRHVRTHLLVICCVAGPADDRRVRAVAAAIRHRASAPRARASGWRRR